MEKNQEKNAIHSQTKKPPLSLSTNTLKLIVNQAKGKHKKYLNQSNHSEIFKRRSKSKSKTESPVKKQNNIFLKLEKDSDNKLKRRLSPVIHIYKAKTQQGFLKDKKELYGVN